MSLQQGLVLHLTMNERDTDGDSLYDRSGYDQHGTITGSPSIVSSSIMRGAYSFPGSSNDKISCDVSTIDWNKDFTLCGWLKIDSSATYSSSNLGGAVIVDPGFDMALFSDSPGPEARFFVLRDDSDKGSTNISAGVEYDDWTHVAGVSENDVASLYVNSKLSAQESIGGSVKPGTTALNSGNKNSADQLEGDLDDVRAYNRALSESEINQLYQMRSQKVRQA